MEKLLSLLSILIICGTAIPNVIAATLNEKQEVKDEVLNLRTEDNLGNLTRYKRQSEFDHIPDVSKHLKNLLNNYVIRINSRSRRLTTNDFSIDLDIKVKEIHEIIQRGVYETAPELVATGSAIVRNDDHIEQKMISDEIIVKTTITESATISNTFDFSGEIEIPSIPKIGTKGKMGFKFSKSHSTTSTKSEEISKKLPSQSVTLEGHSCKKVVSELYASNIVSNNLIAFEVDPSSTFDLQYIGFDSDLIWSASSVKRIINLKEAVEEQVSTYDNRYPTAIYDGITPCIELKDHKLFLKYYPLESKSVKTELFSHIERIDDYEQCLRMRNN